MPIARSRLRMTADELAAYLTEQRVLRLATVGADGWPHVVPLWFVWVDGVFFVHNLRRSRRTRDLDRGSPATLVVDDGISYGELRGVTARVSAELVEESDETQRLRGLFATKYFDAPTMPPMRSHDWRRLRPLELRSWDFRKL